VFFSSSLVYAITGLFGLWAFFDWTIDTAIIFHWMRLPILWLDISACIMLYKFYKARSTIK